MLHSTPNNVVPLHSLVQPSSLVIEQPEPLSEEAERVFFHLQTQQGYQIQQGIKRGLDCFMASLGLLIISPLLLLIALLIRLDSNGPILYKSERIGRDGKPFHMFKFRTMRLNADAEREALRQQANLQGGLFKIKDDPRVTTIGKTLRALSLDELPQLFNVVLGDMSLVGPRPLPADESRLFEAPYTLRFQVYPGITGAWQVNGRSNVTFTELCRLELDYVLGWSLFTDLRILLMTVPAVLASRGAY